MFGRVEQGLGWNAADVQAGAARCGLSVGVAPVVEQQHLHVELGRANGGHIAAGAAADNDKIKFLVSHLPCVLASFCLCLFRSYILLYKSRSMSEWSSLVHLPVSWY